MSSLAPGQRIEARCTRCRDVTGHVIVALVDGQVAKVECCACGSVHKYYPPEAPAREAKSRAVRVQSGRERGEAVLAQARKEPKPKASPNPRLLPAPSSRRRGCRRSWSANGRMRWPVIRPHPYRIP